MLVFMVAVWVEFPFLSDTELKLQHQIHDFCRSSKVTLG